MWEKRRADVRKLLNHWERSKRTRVIPGGGGAAVNYFDRLPDDVVIHILDKLTLKDAAKTPIVSQRFRKLWEPMIRCRRNLDFVGRALSPGFENFVNSMMCIHDGPSVDSLTIAIGENHESFECWIGFARAKRVANLEVSFSHWVPQPAFQIPCWDTMTSLTLRFVQVREAEVENALKSACNLESLFIELTTHLRTLTVSSQSLKRLQFINCRDLHRVNIDFTPNLEFFEQTDSITDSADSRDFRGSLCFKDAAPKLSHVVLDAPFSLYRLSHLHRTGVEKLEMSLGNWQEPYWMSRESCPMLGDLKELKLTFRINERSCFFFAIVSHILPACPQLQKLTLYCNHSPIERYYNTSARHKVEKAELRARSCVHECLKVVEFCGWSGREPEVWAANLVKEIAPNLEKITFR